MADDDTTQPQPAAPAPGSMSGYLQDPTVRALLQQITNPSPPQLPAPPARVSSDGTRPGWLSLLGEGLGGGQSPLYHLSGSAEDSAGARSLLNFGIGMLMASGPQRVRPGLGQIFGSGLQAAQESMDASQKAAFTQAGQQFQQSKDLAQLGIDQQKAKIEQLNAILPLLRLNALQNQPPLYGGNTPAQPLSGAAPLAGGGADIYNLPKDQFLQAVAQRESGGDPNAMNYVAKADPSAYARGATASGKYQMVNSTWETAAKAAGIDTKQYPTAMSAPEALQDKAASALYDMQGTAPWNPTKWTKNWVQGSDGKYALQTAPYQPPGASYKTPPTQAAAPPVPSPVAARTGGTDVAGPGAGPSSTPTAPVAPASPPASALAPPGVMSAGELPGATAPTPTTNPPAVVAPQPTTMATPAPTPPPAVDLKSRPDTELNPEEYMQKHWTFLTPEQVKTYAPGPDGQVAAAAADQVQRAQQQVKAAETQLNQIRSGILPGDVNKAQGQVNDANKELDAAENAYNTTIHSLQSEGAKNLLAADDQQRQQLRADYKASVLDPRNKAAELTQQGQQQIDLENVKTGNATSQELLKAYNTDAANSGKRIDDLELLRGLSDNAGSPTALTSIKVGDRSLADIISATGFGGKDLQDRVGAIQAFRAGVLNTVRELRSGGAATGEPRSNQDLQFVQDMAPSEWQSPATRSAIISFLQQVNQRRIDMASEVARLSATRRGPGGQMIPAGEAIAQARKNLPDFVQTMPSGSMDNSADGLAARKNFFNGIQPHTFFRYPNGRIDLYNGPGG